MKRIVKLLLFGVFVVGGYRLIKLCYTLMEKEKKGKEKYKSLFKMMTKWLENKGTEKEIASYLEEMDIHTVAIYGMSDAGKQLYDELKNTNVQVKYAIDKKAIETDDEIEIITLDSDLRAVDAVIITAINDFSSIAEALKQKTDARIISLEQIVYELSEW